MEIFIQIDQNSLWSYDKCFINSNSMDTMRLLIYMQMRNTDETNRQELGKPKTWNSHNIIRIEPPK